MRRLVIDIGTNSVLALLAEIDNGEIKIVFDDRYTARLGEELASTGKLSDAAMDRTARSVSGFLARERFDEALLLGTEALRAASNTGDFLARVAGITGKEITVLSGEKEAFLTYVGALHGLSDIARNIMVIDVGGGSSEVSVGIAGAFAHAVSVPVGAATLHDPDGEDALESYSRRAVRMIMDKIGGMELGESDQIVATGGTITSLAAIHLGMDRYDPPRIHGINLSVEEIMKIARRFEGVGVKKRQDLIPLDPARADLVLPGAGIILALLGISGRDRLRVSTGGLRFGAVLKPEVIGE